jgi:glutaminase
VIVYSSSAHSRLINISHTVQIRSNQRIRGNHRLKNSSGENVQEINETLSGIITVYGSYECDTKHCWEAHCRQGCAWHCSARYCSVMHCIVADHAVEVKGPDKRAAVSAAVLFVFPPSAKLSLRSLSFEPKECLTSALIFIHILDQYG